jgi:hypothetical protein
MSDDWYYAENDHYVGPLSIQQLEEVLGSIQSWGDTLVWRSGFADWKRADHVPELTAMRRSPPPVPKMKKQVPLWHAIIAILFLGSVASRVGINEIALASSERRRMRQSAKALQRSEGE